MGFLQSIRAKELDLSSLEDTIILDAIDNKEMIGSTSWLGSRRVSIVGQEGFASYGKLAEKVHEILGKDIPKSLPERGVRYYHIEYVQSLHPSGVIRKIVNLLASVFLVATFFNYNQSLRDLEKDKMALRRFKTSHPGSHTFVGKKIKINKKEYTELTESQFKEAAFKAQLRDARSQNIKEMQENIEEMQEQIKKKNSVIIGLGRQLNKSEGDVRRLKEKVAQLEKDIKSLRNQEQTE